MSIPSRLWTRASLMALLCLIFALVAFPAQPPWADAAQVPELAARRQINAPTAFGSPTVDGLIDAVYGDPIASDPAGDGGGNSNLDLLDLYIAHDSAYFYFAFTINDNVGTTNWGKYVLYIDTTNDPNGATSDAWGRSVAVSDPHKPEFGIYSWVDQAPYGTEDIQLWSWGGSSWSQIGTVDEAALGAGTPSIIEWKVAKADLGYPDTIWVEVWDTGGGGGDNARDTINDPADDWNGPSGDWSSPATLSNSTRYGPPEIDGIKDAVYGSPAAADPLGDISEPNLDLNGLYITEDSSNYYIGFDAYASTWGMAYGIYLDTNQVSGSGATADPWGRAVNAVAEHYPEYALYVWHRDDDTLEDAQLATWDGSSWSYPSLISLGGAQGYNKDNDWLEYRIPKSALGNPERIAVELFTTGGSGHAQDTAPSDPNVAYSDPDWGSDTTTLSAFYVFPPETEPSGAGHDNDVWWDDLGHNSRDPLYRSPGGAVTTGTEVKLRLRAARNDLTDAKVRLWNDRADSQMILSMTRVAEDATYEWWEATVPASAEPTIYWYRFIAIDGTATAYYEDDSARTGGWGQTIGSSADRSWQLTVYDPAFQTPDWVKNAVIYQIFPDRFRDGDPSNNTPAGSFFYGGETIYRSNDADGYWNAPVCDPRDSAGDCPGQWSENFYGGDLKGISDTLDYLESLGVTALYLNPIFESPSNHKYDTTDYSIIDDNFGDLATFQALVAQAESRGIRIILDGVFNHTSSDSIYFDRYGRYSEVGACESPDSPYRDWYYFRDVTPGAGECAGSDGTPNAATYESWFGYDSLPKLQADNPDVRALIWSNGASSIGPSWISEGADGWRLDVGGDVDPGLTNNPDNDYWEGFRQAVRAASPTSDTYIVGEEWGLATAWTLGFEWDATMNYQFSSAVLSFWRDEPFIDNDHNANSSAGELQPLTPSELDEQLRNLEERYPPEAFYAMMNLLGSHDTNRALFMLDHNTELNDRSIYEDSTYDWSDAIERLKGVALLQMTLPGAPTIYYGDEIGLVAPPTYSGDRWEDDPYNRIPFPWSDTIDETKALSLYEHLRDGENSALRDYYALLAGTRNSHPALRTGSFDTLLVDDENNMYAYGRKLADHSDAAVVIVNRATTPQTITVDVAGYLPYGATFIDVLNGNAPYSIDSAGAITVPNVPARSGALLVLSSTAPQAPAAVADLAVTDERNTEVDLAWTAVISATSYDIYRSLVSGGGYELITTTTALSYTDSGLANATRYYYVVVSRDDTTGLTGGYSNEASGMPQHDLASAWFNLQWPTEITHTISTITPTVDIYGQLWIDGETGSTGPADGIKAQVGYGPSADPPTASTWRWEDMAYGSAVGNNDEYVGNLLPDTLGDYLYTTRWSSDGGETWYYTDLNGPSYDASAAGRLHVIASSDMTAPAAPQNLRIESASPGSIDLAWDANTEPDLAGYEIYRQNVASPGFTLVDTVGAAATSYSDIAVVTGETYDYYIVAYDTSFNRSPQSNTVQATAETRMVDVTFRVLVPDETPADATIYIAGDISLFGPWNPSKQPLTKIGENLWEVTVEIADGTMLQYKYTRGSWETVENWRSITGFANRSVTIDYGTDGTQLVDNTLTDWGTGEDSQKAVEFWRDALVEVVDPAQRLRNATSAISVTWATPISATGALTSVITVVDWAGNPVEGTVTAVGDNSFVFTPISPLRPGAYTVTAFNVRRSDVGDGEVQQAPYTWTVVFGSRRFLPIIWR